MARRRSFHLPGRVPRRGRRAGRGRPHARVRRTPLQRPPVGSSTRARSVCGCSIQAASRVLSEPGEAMLFARPAASTMRQMPAPCQLPRSKRRIPLARAQATSTSTGAEPRTTTPLQPRSATPRGDGQGRLSRTRQAVRASCARTGGCRSHQAGEASFGLRIGRGKDLRAVNRPWCHPGVGHLEVRLTDDGVAKRRNSGASSRSASSKRRAVLNASRSYLPPCTQARYGLSLTGIARIWGVTSLRSVVVAGSGAPARANRRLRSS